MNAGSPSMDKGTPAPITAYFRTLNEAATIGEALLGAARVADEIIVVDSGSKDGTIDIARSLGAKVVHQTWLGSGLQKRVAEDAARHDWLLDLDADEIVSVALADEIRNLFVDGTPAHTIYRTPMAYAPPHGDPWVGFGGVTRHKLYDRRAVRQPEHATWDQFELPSGVAIGRLQNALLHRAWRDTAHLVDKVNRNSSTRARTLPLKGRSVLAYRIVFGLPVYVTKRFILDGLFRAGVDGFAFSVISGFGRWLKDVKMYERLRTEHTQANVASQTLPMTDTQARDRQ